MGRELYRQLPAARAIFEQASAAVDVNLARLCLEGPEDSLTATENAQPAMLTLSVALLRALDECAPGRRAARPQAVAGHSLGEYSALVAAEALDLVTAVRLVQRRGELMAAAHEGTMAAVMGLDADALDAICALAAAETQQPVVIANYNAPGQLVMSGALSAVERAGMLAKERGAKRVKPLKVSAAFHSPLMERAAQGMAATLAHTIITDPCLPVVANVSAAPLTSAEAVRQELVSQVVAPVRWIASVQYMLQQGISTFVEIGSGTVLTGLIKRIAPTARLVNLRDIDDVQAFMAVMAEE
jgi:[acyl-carrier-protein] S-malonyltransferase